jgi:hypothetical protein
MRVSHLCGGLSVAAALAVAGCGESAGRSRNGARHWHSTPARPGRPATTVIDSAKVEKFTGKIVTRAGIAVKWVSCPKDPKAKKGATFKCTVTGSDGSKGAATVTQSDAKGNVKVNAPFMDPNVVETQTAKQIKEQLKTTVSVNCPEIVIVNASATYLCDATDGTNTRKVKITITDANGSFTFKLV